MSQFQLGLGVLGVMVLVGMVAYYIWLTRRLRPRQAAPSVGQMLGDAQEPTLQEPTFDADEFVLPVPERKPGLDALIDVIAPIALDAPASGDAVLAAMPPTRRVGSKPFAVEGLNATTHLWEAAVAGQRYSQLQAGLQLANRAGALNDIEFSEFVVKAQAFCDAVGGTPDFPDMRQEVNRARELDQFAHDHDAQLTVVLRARRTAWSPTYVQQMLTRQGFVPGAMVGRMVLPASTVGAAPVLSVSFDSQAALAEDMTQSALREFVLSLDVAQVDRTEAPFARMREVASLLAQEMDALLTDDNGVALPNEALDVIAAELEHLNDTLDQRELSAGSVLARRLFS